jgi:hypothetical protein
MISFEDELQHLIHRFSLETDSGTPDYILARYMAACLSAFHEAVRARERHYGRQWWTDDDADPPAAPPGEEGR